MSNKKYEFPELQLQLVETSDVVYDREPAYSKRDRNGGKKKPPIKTIKPWMRFPGANSGSYRLSEYQIDQMINGNNNITPQ